MIKLFGRARELTRDLRQGVIAVIDYRQNKLGVPNDRASEIRSFTMDEQGSTHIPGYPSDMVRMIRGQTHGGLIQVLNAAVIHNRWLRPAQVEHAPRRLSPQLAAVFHPWVPPLRCTQH